MSHIAKALEQLNDKEALARVLAWANSRFGDGRVQQAVAPLFSSPKLGTTVAAVRSQPQRHDYEDIFECDEDGAVRVITRDLKAKSRNDAAIRLAHIVLLASEMASGQKEASSKNVLLPVLREWRAYDANTRVALARHPGIKRNGDLLSLDLHSRRDAESYIREIRDESTKGEWSAISSVRKRKKNGSKTQTIDPH